MYKFPTLHFSDLTMEVPQSEDITKLHSHYHKQRWCRQQLYFKFKRQNAFFNALALVLVAVGMVVGTAAQESLVMVILTALSALLKGWVDFK